MFGIFSRAATLCQLANVSLSHIHSFPFHKGGGGGGEDGGDGYYGAGSPFISQLTHKAKRYLWLPWLKVTE